MVAIGRTSCFVVLWALTSFLRVFYPKCLGVWISLKFYRIVKTIIWQNIYGGKTSRLVVIWRVFHEFDIGNYFELKFEIIFIFWVLFTILRDRINKCMTNYLLRKFLRIPFFTKTLSIDLKSVKVCKRWPEKDFSFKFEVIMMFSGVEKLRKRANLCAKWCSFIYSAFTELSVHRWWKNLLEF